MSKEHDITAALLELLRRFPNANVTADTLAAIEEDMSPFEPRVVIAALIYLRTRARFFPTSAEIIDTIYELCPGDAYETAQAAWQLVRRGRLADHPDKDLIHDAFNDVTTREDLGNATAYEARQMKREFAKRYAEIVEKDRRELRLDASVRALLEGVEAPRLIAKPGSDKP